MILKVKTLETNTLYVHRYNYLLANKINGYTYITIKIYILLHSIHVLTSFLWWYFHLCVVISTVLFFESIVRRPKGLSVP